MRLTQASWTIDEIQTETFSYKTWLETLAITTALRSHKLYPEYCNDADPSGNFSRQFYVLGARKSFVQLSWHRFLVSPVHNSFDLRISCLSFAISRIEELDLISLIVSQALNILNLTVIILSMSMTNTLLNLA